MEGQMLGHYEQVQLHVSHMLRTFQKTFMNPHLRSLNGNRKHMWNRITIQRNRRTGYKLKLHPEIHYMPLVVCSMYDTKIV